MIRDLAGKVAFITGGGSGVGLGQAKVLVEEAQMRVVIADVRDDQLQKAVSYFTEKRLPVYPIHLDITNREAYVQAADEAERAVGPIISVAVGSAAARQVREGDEAARCDATVLPTLGREKAGVARCRA